MIKENLCYSDYIICETRQSQIDPDAHIRVETGFRCPRCKKEQPLLGHGEKGRCLGCGLRMIAHGNGLECTSNRMLNKAVKGLIKNKDKQKKE